MLREPGLRRRARKQFERRLRATARDGRPRLCPLLVSALAWSIVGALFAIGMSLRYRATLEAFAPADWIVWALMAAVWIAVFLPVVFGVGRPLVQRAAASRRGGDA